MRTLHRACNLIVSAVAANDMYLLEDIKEAVVELVKESCRKVNDTNNKGKMVVPNPTISPGQVIVHASLLLSGVPNQWGAATTIGNPGQLPPNPPTAHVPAGGQLGEAPRGAAGPNVLAAQVDVPAAGQLGQAPLGAAGPNVHAAQVNVPAAEKLGQAPPGVAGQNVLAAQVNLPAAGQLGQAPPCAAGPNTPAAQVNLPAAGQLGLTPPGDVLAAGPDVTVEPGNDPAHPQMVSDSSSPDNDPVLAQILPDPLHNGPAAVQNQPVSRGFHPAPNLRPTG